MDSGWEMATVVDLQQWQWDGERGTETNEQPILRALASPSGNVVTMSGHPGQDSWLKDHEDQSLMCKRLSAEQ